MRLRLKVRRHANRPLRTYGTAAYRKKSGAGYKQQRGGRGFGDDGDTQGLLVALKGRVNHDPFAPEGGVGSELVVGEGLARGWIGKPPHVWHCSDRRRSANYTVLSSGLQIWASLHIEACNRARGRRHVVNVIL